MRFGKIEYLNLLVFDVFIKHYKMSSNLKSMFFLKKSYPSKLNKDFLFRRIDAGFISSIAGIHSHRIPKAYNVGIIANKEVWSVLVLPSELGDDYQSATSNALSKLLDLEGRVLIGNRALQYYHANRHKKCFIDMANVWHNKTGLPFIFGRVCVNGYTNFYGRLMLDFANRLGRGKACFKGIKIPHYIIMNSIRDIGISKGFALSYLKHIYYKIGYKERHSLDRFYRGLRLIGIKPPKRF